MTAAPRSRGPGFLDALAVVFAMQVRALLSRKRLVFLVILLLLPPFVTLMMKLESPDAAADWADFAPQAYLVFILPILAIFHGASAIADEVDERTLGYLLTRPISRDVIAFGKVTGATAVTAVLASFSFALSHQIMCWSGRPLGFLAGEAGREFLAFVGLIAWGSLLYTSFAALVSLLVRWPTIASILYVGMVEIACCYVPGPLARMAMTTQFMRLLPARFHTVEWNVTRAVGQQPATPDPWAAAGLLLLVTGLVTIALLKRFREFDLSGGSEGDQ